MREYKDVQKFVDTAELLKSSSKTLRDIYEISTTLHAKEKAALYFDEDGRKQTYTYERYKSLCYYCAKHLSGCLSGVPAGSLVALKMRNSPNWPLLFWGLEMSGHPVLLIDAKLAHENTENLLRQSSASAILVNEEESYGVPSFRLNEIRNAEEDDQFAPRWANEVIFCSSGTTGAAKMMVYEGHCLCDQIYSAIDMPKETLDILHPGRTNILAMVPLHHIFGFCATFLWYTFYGKCFVYSPSTSTRDLLMAIHRAPVTHLYSVPMFWDAIAQNVERSASLKGERSKRILDNMVAYNCHQISREEAGKGAWPLTRTLIQKKALGTAIEYCISGGGYLSPKTANIINGLGYPLYNGYGMTEIGVSSVELSPRVEDRLKGSIGHPLVGVRYKIEENPSSPNHAQGQLWVSSPVLHTEEIINGVRKKTDLVDGFYPTGDIAEMDASGSYYIKGRIKDTIINSNGENVYPDEIETYFKDIKHVVNDVVVGIKEGLNEKIVLILELDNTIQPSEMTKLKADVDAINAKLPNEKKVQETLIYKKTMPLANNMKVKRYVLRDALNNGRNDDFTTFEGPRRSTSFVGYDPEEVKTVMAEVRSIFSKTLLLPDFKIGDDAVWTIDLGGDSMSYVSMVSDLNDAFKLVIPTEEYGRLTCVKDFTLEILELRHSPSSQQK